MDEYEIYEAECENIKKENGQIIEQFEKYLKTINLSKSTIDKHAGNVTFYINDFLLYEEPLKAVEGVNMVGHFLGYWFIRKAMWASKSSINENISSLKHFYTFLSSIGEISLEQLSEMKEEIKENKNDWLEAISKYDDPDTDLEDIW